METARQRGMAQEELDMKVRSEDYTELINTVRKQIMDELAAGLELKDYHQEAFIKLHMNDCGNMREDIHNLKIRLKGGISGSGAQVQEVVLRDVERAYEGIAKAMERIKKLEDKLKNPKELLRLSIDTFKLGEKDDQRQETREGSSEPNCTIERLS